jgi:hypothetical protein
MTEPEAKTHSGADGHETKAAKLTRAEYFAERALLIDARQRGYQRAEQMLTGGATGALLLSITFLEKIIPADTVTDADLLVGAWSVLLVCLSCSLAGQYASARAFGCELARLDASVHDRPVPSNRWATLNRVLGAVTPVLLVVGIQLLAWFAYVNAPFNRGGQ